MKPFLRLKGGRHDAGPAMCVCDLRADHPMRISFIKRRDGVVRAYVEECRDGRVSWWPYGNMDLTEASLTVRPA